MCQYDAQKRCTSNDLWNNIIKMLMSVPLAPSDRLLEALLVTREEARANDIFDHQLEEVFEVKYIFIILAFFVEICCLHLKFI